MIIQYTRLQKALISIIHVGLCNNSHPLEDVGRGSETQLQASKNLDLITECFN